MPKYVLVSGKRGCGKDTIGEGIQNSIGDRSTIMGFSYMNKHKFCQNENLDYDRLLHDYDYKCKYRDTLNTFTNARFKRDGELTFVNDLMEYARDKPKDQVIVVPDFRFVHEAQFFERIRKDGNKVIMVRVVTDNDIREKRGWVYNYDIDESKYEICLDVYKDFDAVIHNNGSKKELQDKVTNEIIKKFDL